jgi:DNA-directed RNA polymerase subunit RPC12/RpoP
MDLKELVCPNCGFPAPEIVQRKSFVCPACGSYLEMTDLQADTSILCPQCRTVNPDTQQHCANCGEKLKFNCPFCYTPNPIDNLNCANCGVNLQTAQKRKKEWLEENRRLTEERMRLTRQAEAEGQKRRMQQLIDDLDEPRNHNFAIYCLTQMGKSAVGALIETLQSDPDPDARFGAAIALGNIKDPAAIPVLIQASWDPEPAIRYWSVDALQKFATQAAVEAIKKHLDDPHHGVKDRARRALTDLGVPFKKADWWPLG